VDAVLELVAVRIDDADPTAEVERQRGHRFVVAIEEDAIEAARVDLASHAPPGERGLVRLHVIGEQRGERDRDRGAHHHRGERPAREDQHERGGGEEQRRLHEHGSARRPLRRCRQPRARDPCRAENRDPRERHRREREAVSDALDLARKEERRTGQRHHHVVVRLRAREREEQQRDEEGEPQETARRRVVVDVAGGREGEHRPRQHRGEDARQVVPDRPMVVIVRLAQVEEAQEVLVHEVEPAEGGLGAPCEHVPGNRDRREERDRRRVEEAAQALAPRFERSREREGEADGADEHDRHESLGEHGRREGRGREEHPSASRIAHQRFVHRDQRPGVEPGEEPVEHEHAAHAEEKRRGRGDAHGEHRGALAPFAPREPGDREERQHQAEDRHRARGELAHAEHRIGERREPIEHRRLLEIGNAVERRDGPRMRREHLACDRRVEALVVVLQRVVHAHREHQRDAAGEGDERAPSRPCGGDIAPKRERSGEDGGQAAGCELGRFSGHRRSVRVRVRAMDRRAARTFGNGRWTAR